MLIVALTGGIGSGKTTVSNLFKQRGAHIVDADKINHQLTQPGSKLETTIIRHFGADVVCTKGTLDRKKCRHLIFSNPQHKKWLETLLHPAIREEIKNQIKLSRSPYTLVVIPLLVETNHYQYIHRVCVLDIDAETQLARAKARDHASDEDIKRIMASQARQSARLSIADDIIVNNEQVEKLNQQVDNLHALYMQLSCDY